MVLAVFSTAAVVELHRPCGLFDVDPKASSPVLGKGGHGQGFRFSCFCLQPRHSWLHVKPCDLQLESIPESLLSRAQKSWPQSLQETTCRSINVENDLHRHCCHQHHQHHHDHHQTMPRSSWHDTALFPVLKLGHS